MLTAFEPYSDFRATSAEVLQYLHDRYGFSLWMITRIEGEDWIVLQAEDHGYDVSEGDVFRWTDSFCSQMVQGNGPCIAPTSALVPAYAKAPIGQQVSIAAYVGLPLTNPDGSLFGTLCAIDPQAQPESLVDELPKLQLISRMLGTILASELKTEEETRRAERVELEAATDSVTGLYNLRGWTELLSAEESRCRKYGHPATVLSVDLDQLRSVNDFDGCVSGDLLLQKAARALVIGTRERDAVARIEGDEFAILAVHCNQAQAVDMQAKVEQFLRREGLQATIGVARRHPSKSLNDAWLTAKQNLRDSLQQCESQRPTVYVPEHDTDHASFPLRLFADNADGGVH